MEPRLALAYSLILLLAVCAAALLGYRHYHSRAQSYARRLRREDKQHARDISEQEDGQSE